MFKIEADHKIEEDDWNINLKKKPFVYVTFSKYFLGEIKLRATTRRAATNSFGASPDRS